MLGTYRKDDPEKSEEVVSTGELPSDMKQRPRIHNKPFKTPDYIEAEKRKSIRASFKTLHFGRSLRWAKISILEIYLICLWLKFPLRLELDRTETF